MDTMVNPFNKVLGTLPEDAVDDDEIDYTGLNTVTILPKELTVSEMLKRIWDYHDKLGHDTYKSEEERVQILREGCLALFMEVAELTDSFPWKPWRKIDDQTSDKDNACREMVDIFFFLAKVMRAAKITPEEFIAKFEWVLNNNLDRLKNGYSKALRFCPACYEKVDYITDTLACAKCGEKTLDF
jgi:hypothetical protein